MSRLQVELPEIDLAMRDHFQGKGDHLRQPEAMAHLFLGFDLFLRFAHDVGVVDSNAVESWREKAIAALEDSARAQAHSMCDVDQAEMMLEGLRTLLEQGQVQLASEEGHTRSDRGLVVGKYDGQDCFLLPRALKKHVHEFYRQSGEQWNPSLKALGSALLRKRYIRPAPEKGRNQVERRMDGARMLGWLMPVAVLRPPTGPAHRFSRSSGDTGDLSNGSISRRISFGEASQPPDPPDPPVSEGMGYWNGRSKGG